MVFYAFVVWKDKEIASQSSRSKATSETFQAAKTLLMQWIKFASTNGFGPFVFSKVGPWPET
jgi:hypothetical protein